MNRASISYGHGSVENTDVVRVITHVGEGADAVPALAHWDEQAGKWGLFPMKWIPIRVATITGPKPCVYALAADGRIGFGHGSYSEETIDDSTEGTRARGPMRDIRVIGGELYATGMGRQVYRRSAAGPWVRADAGVVVPLGEIAVSGFSSIHGSAPDDLWAVGTMGEIWHFGTRWKRHDSPTSLVLHRVVAVSPTEVYATGQKGLVLKFDGTGWGVAAADASLGNLWGAQWFQDEFYVSSEHAVLRLRGDTLEPVPIEAAKSFGHLDAQDGVLWSFGTTHLAFTRDGTTWQPVKSLV